MFSKTLRAALYSLPLILAACGGGGASEGGAGEAGKSTDDTIKSFTNATDMMLGAKDATVTVIEYASVTCPHCAAFHETIYPEIKEKYIDSGKIKFVFREFPTPPQGLSYVGSVLARCAAEKGGSDAYFLVIGTLFKTQKTWIYGEDPKLELEKIATQAGMDTAAFDACMQRQDLVDLINKNVTDGADTYGINSTPTFVIEGEKVMGVRSTEDLEAKLDEAIAAKAEKRE